MDHPRLLLGAPGRWARLLGKGEHAAAAARPRVTGRRSSTRQEAWDREDEGDGGCCHSHRYLNGAAVRASEPGPARQPADVDGRVLWAPPRQPTGPDPASLVERLSLLPLLTEGATCPNVPEGARGAGGPGGAALQEGIPHAAAKQLRVNLGEQLTEVRQILSFPIPPNKRGLQPPSFPIRRLNLPPQTLDRLALVALEPGAARRRRGELPGPLRPFSQT